MKFKALGVLVSGRGSNLKALIEAREKGELPLPIRVVLSDREDAPALDLAQRAGIPAFYVPSGPPKSRLTPEMEKDYVARLKEHGVDLIALAGFMRVLHAPFLDPFPWAIVNIHPSLLPAFPGLNAPTQAFEWGARFAGCTAHFVTAGVDAGPIIDQSIVPVSPDDTAESLTARILEEEHRLYPKAIARLARGELRLRGRRVVTA